MRSAILIAILALAACGPRVPPIVQGDPTATATLVAMPDAQFFAQTRLARQISDRCATIGFNQGFNAALVNQRYGENSRAAIAIANGRGVDLELDVATRSLQARYNVDLNSADLCAVGLGELGRKSAVSAVLIPV